MNNYYLGLDIGTNSVGWAVTDEEYNIIRRKGKSLWGIRLFEQANTADERRAYRSSRRRLNRKKQRIDLLQMLFAEEMAKVDPTFFLRLNESRLHREDKSEDSKYPLFIEKDYSDIDYYKQYPTIFHLRQELISNGEEHDIRLVYLALHNIIKHRGHFLIEGDLESANSFNQIMETLVTALYDETDIEISINNAEEFENILKDKKVARSTKQKRLFTLIDINFKDADKAEQKALKNVIDHVCKLIAGNTGELEKIFRCSFEDLEKTKVKFSDSSYEEAIKPELGGLYPEKCYLLDVIKAVYDWSVLADILGDEEYISFAKVKQYDRHKENLKLLKAIMKKYCDSKTYREFFKNPNEKNSYAAYIGSVKTNGNKYDVSKSNNDEEFYKELKNILSRIDADKTDKEALDYLKSEVETQSLLPKQRNKDNGVVPNQVHRLELEAILKNAEIYLPFLSEIDSAGLSVSDKIISIFSFRIPYYVGPLSDKHKNMGGNSWIVRKEAGIIYPWNLNDKVDMAASNEQFIRRMTNKCTYISGEDVVPKASLLYSRYMVLNELNNLKIRGKEITVALKQEIYNELFKCHNKVTGKMLLNYLKRYDSELSKEDLSGFDQDFKSTLAPYIDFEKKVFGDKIKEDVYRHIAEDIIRWKTIYGDDSRMVKAVAESVYPDVVTESQYKAIASLKYSGWGNFSEMFLRGIEGTDKETGEVFTIIDALWETNNNLMQLLSERFTFREAISEYNKDKMEVITAVNYENVVGNLYVSPKNKRAIWQTIQIVEEIKKVMGSEPKRIFVEMARGDEEKKPTVSRKNNLLDLYAACKDDTRNWCKEIEAREEREFNSMKLYLYYTQMGRCMYTGEPIDLNELMSANSKWDRDHIYPQSVIKDDSIDNLVLVKKIDNAKKTNNMLSHDIQKKMISFWKQLLEMNLISKSKYDRLTRGDDFTFDELAGFISRQIVETRQASKAVAEVLDRINEHSQIVYVKAGLVSRFREKDLKELKCRRINDYHHAKDAYLNIVVGNVYNSKFTSNPRQWVKENYKNNYSINRVFDYDVYRGKALVWKAPDKGEKGALKTGGSIDTVRATMKKNDILYTEYTYCGKGMLFNETIAKKNAKPKVPLKEGLPVEKYGGYVSPNTSYFALIEFDGKKGDRVRNIIGVPVYIANVLDRKPDAFLEYCEKDKGLGNVKIIKGKIKKNSLLVFNGFPMRIRGENEKDIMLKGNVQLILNQESSDIVRKIEKYLEKNSEYDVNKKFDAIGDEDLNFLYDQLVNKMEYSVYERRPAKQIDMLKEKREDFQKLELRAKAILLNQIINLLRCDIATTADFKIIGKGANSGKISVNKNTLGNGEITFINQSVTGIFESREEL